MIGKRQLLGNSLSLLANRLTQSLTTFVLVASIARILGSYALGQYMLAFSYYFVFMTLSSQGFKTLFTRELSRNPLETPVYLVSGTLLQLLFSVLGYVALVIVVFALPYSWDTSIVCYVMGLTILPFGLSNITEAIFQAQEKMYLIALSTVPVYILRVLVMIWAMQLSYGVSLVSAILVISETLILLVEWILILRFAKPKWQINSDFMWQTMKSARTFLAIEGLAVVQGRMQLFILSLLGGEVLVGLYGGIAQLMQPFDIFSYSLLVGVFPSLSKAVTLGREKQRQLVENLIEILLIVALPIILGIFFLGGDLLVFVYRDPSFANASVAFNLVAVGLIMISLAPPLSYLLVANSFERVNLREVTTTTVLGGLISVPLVSRYQLIGAAIALLIMRVIGCSQYVYAVYNRLFSLRLWRITRRPLLISIFMLAIFVILQKIDLGFLPTLITASFAYAFLVGVLVIYALGGPSVVWAKMLQKLN